MRYPLLAALCIALAALPLLSCTKEGTQAVSAEVTALKNQLDDQRDAALLERARHEAALTTATAAGDAAAVAKAAKDRDEAAENIAVIDKIRAGLAIGDTVFEASRQPDGSIDIVPAVATAASEFGGPYGKLVGMGILLAYGVFQHWQKTKARADTASIIKGIDKVSIADPKLNDDLNKVWPQVRAEMTPDAKAADTALSET